MKLSIIIPVYGVEKFVADCIESCVENIGSASDDVELIVVDDGSKDHSIDIVRNLTMNLSYVRIISQINQGLSMARNNGLNEAKGDFVWFVDSDDIIANGVVSYILNVIEGVKDLDMLELSFKKVDECVDRNTLSGDPLKYDDKVFQGRDRFVRGFNTPVPFHVFSRLFLEREDLRMYPGIYHEDSEFTPRAIWKAKRVVKLQGVSYYYRQRGNSIMTTSNPKKGEDYIFVSHRLQDFFKCQEVDKEKRLAINDYIAMIYCNGLHNVLGASKKDFKRVAIAAYEHRKVLQSLKRAKQPKYRILGFWGSLFPKHIADIYYMMMKTSNK